REHNMTLLRTLTDVDVPGTQAERPCDRLLLILQGGARQMEMPQVQARFLLRRWKEPDPEPRVIARQERNAVAGVVGHLPAQHPAPEARETKRVVRIDAHRQELAGHPLRTPDQSQPRTRYVPGAQGESYSRGPARPSE